MLYIFWFIKYNRMHFLFVSLILYFFFFIFCGYFLVSLSISSGSVLFFEFEIKTSRNKSILLTQLLVLGQSSLWWTNCIPPFSFTNFTFSFPKNSSCHTSIVYTVFCCCQFGFSIYTLFQVLRASSTSHTL